MMDIYPEDPSCGSLTLDRVEGLVYRRLADERLECLGPVMDMDLAPDDLLDEWTTLRIWWLESGDYGRACEAEVDRSWYDRLSVARMN